MVPSYSGAHQYPTISAKRDRSINKPYKGQIKGTAGSCSIHLDESCHQNCIPFAFRRTLHPPAHGVIFLKANDTDRQLRHPSVHPRLLRGIFGSENLDKLGANGCCTSIRKAIPVYAPLGERISSFLFIVKRSGPPHSFRTFTNCMILQVWLFGFGPYLADPKSALLRVVCKVPACHEELKQFSERKCSQLLYAVACDCLLQLFIRDLIAIRFLGISNGRDKLNSRGGGSVSQYQPFAFTTISRGSAQGVQHSVTLLKR